MQLFYVPAQGCLDVVCPRDQFHLHTPESHTRSYTFNKHTIQHRFCEACGIHAYAQGTGPGGQDVACINVRCLEGIDLDALPIKHYDGRSL